MPDEASSTRDKLLDAAARLFAERGINDVSLAEIVRAAGQRNASAVHYHLGNRDAVLRAILERHIPTIRHRRLELLEIARSSPSDDVRVVAEAIVRPVTEFAQRGWRERAYLQIGSELISYMNRTTPEIRRLLRETAGQEALELLADRFPALPRDLWLERSAVMTAFLGRAAADRARQLDTGGRAVLSDEAFVANLIDMFIGAITAPVSVRETR
jgi:AcrR family transcriptional regulator